MNDETSKTPAGTDDGEPPKELTPAARRALQEAEARRQHYRRKEAALPREIGGRGGKEPGRYGDWEVKGLTSDF
ncbi:DUF1674 domain-containing protein [Mesorhizobium sp. Cs1321R2N1]|uniref:DUF1674 domain-containing protein n=1 Tax=Mesorhizobium sp. Cs1321R2N1 TaxID=3015174 RepID=UPI00301DF57D